MHTGCCAQIKASLRDYKYSKTALWVKMELIAVMRYVFLDLSSDKHLIFSAAYHSNNVCYCQNAYLIFTAQTFWESGFWRYSCKNVMLLPQCLSLTPISRLSIQIDFFPGSGGLGLFWGHVVPGGGVFFSFFCPWDIWTLALCFAESCWLFLAQGHGGKSHKKRNYIIAYLEAVRFHGSHPSNVWDVLEPIKRWFC